MRTVDSLARRWVPALVGALVLTSLVGFFPGYFRQFPRFERSGWQVHFHFATIVAWLVMLVAQATFAARGRLELHRRVGRWSYVLVPLILLGFALVTDFGQRRHREPALLGATLFDGTLFLVFYVLAIWKRKDSALHARYMMLTAVAFINPALGRAIAPQVSMPFELLVLLALLVLSRVKRWPMQPFAVGALVWVVLLATIVYCSVVEPTIIERLWAVLFGGGGAAS